MAKKIIAPYNVSDFIPDDVDETAVVSVCSLKAVVGSLVSIINELDGKISSLNSSVDSFNSYLDEE
jgi:hypothetical protein